VEENFAGRWSRASEDKQAEHRENAEERSHLFAGSIVAAHDGWWVMRVADSVGQSAPGMAASMLNPAFGLSLIYAQTFETASVEFEESMRAQGKSYTSEEVEAYAHMNAMYQTPWELLGDVAVGKMVKGIFKSIPRGTITAGPDAFGKWLGPQFEKMATATAGEVFVTTPGQTLGEAFLAERAGVRAPTTFGEKVAQTGDAMSIALGSVAFTGGASMATAGAIKAGKGDFFDQTYDAPKLAKTLEENPSDPRSQALTKWFHGGWREMQNGDHPELTNTLTDLVRRLPPFKADGPIYRAVRFKTDRQRVDFLKMFEGKSWENDRPFMSASKDVKVARQQLKHSPFPVVLEIEGNLTGKDMGWFDSMNSSYSWQKEVLFLRGATFNILGTRAIDVDGKEVYIIRLSETL